MVSCAQATAEEASQLVDAVHKWPMRNVRWMSIHLYLQCEGGGGQMRIKRWLLELLASMDKLHSLKLFMQEWCPRPMSVLQQLKHLDIRLTNHPSVQELARIAALPCLETLRLLARCAQMVEELDMSASVRLRAVSFVDVHAKKLLLPPDTALTVEGYSENLMRHAKAYVGRCRGLHVNFDSPGVDIIEHNTFYKGILANDNLHLLTALSLSGIPSYLFGMEQIHFGESVRNLRFLCATSDNDANIKLSLPNLCTLALYIEGRLELEVDDLESTAARLDDMFLGWVSSDTVPGVRAVFERVCRENVWYYDNITRIADHESPLGMQGMSFNQAPFGYVSPCHTASGACGACIVPQYGTSNPGLARSGGLCCPRDERENWIKVHVGWYGERS